MNGPLLGASYSLCWSKPRGIRPGDDYGLDRESPFYFHKGDVPQVIWKVAEIIAYLSAFFSLALRELISSGTPVGVGPGECGDRLCCAIEGIGKPNLQVD